MGQLTVRNLDEIIVDALKQRARQHGRSAEAEHRLILREALLNDGQFSREEIDAFNATAERLRARLKTSAPSTDVIREMRDTRHAG